MPIRSECESGVASAADAIEAGASFTAAGNAAAGSVARERDDEVRTPVLSLGAVAGCARPRREGAGPGSECAEPRSTALTLSVEQRGAETVIVRADAGAEKPASSRAPRISETRRSDLIERVRPPCWLNRTDGMRFWLPVQ